jgi:hypothetical protein
MLSIPRSDSVQEMNEHFAREFPLFSRDDCLLTSTGKSPTVHEVEGMNEVYKTLIYLNSHPPHHREDLPVHEVDGGVWSRD